MQPDSITDQMLYSKIASSPELRANITTFMRARGYVSDADLESYVASGNADDVLSSLQAFPNTRPPIWPPIGFRPIPSRTTNSYPATSVSGAGTAPYGTTRRPDRTASYHQAE